MQKKFQRHCMKKNFLAAFVCAAVIPLQGQKSAGPSIKIDRTVSGCISIDETMLYPDRYILTRDAVNRSLYAVYDISAANLTVFPKLDSLAGIPAAPQVTSTGKDSAYERSGLKIAGKYFTWRSPIPAYYNPGAKRAGIFYDMEKSHKFIEGNPKCAKCGSESELVPQFNRYLCRSCRLYVDEKDYIKSEYIPHYAEIELPSFRVVSFTPLEKISDLKELGWVRPIGTDSEGKYFYYMNNNYLYGRKSTSGKLLLYRFNIAAKKTDWKFEINVPVREKGKCSLTYDISASASADMSKIFFCEYDETGDKPGAGYLSNPGPQGWIVDTRAKTHFAFNVPVTAYGRAFDRAGEFFALGSNQTGAIHVISLKDKKEKMKATASKSIFMLSFTPDSKHLLSFNKSGVDVFAWPAMKKTKTIPLSQIFPGAKQLLSSEAMYAGGDGNYLAISVLVKSANGPWWSKDFNAGFHLLRVEN